MKFKLLFLSLILGFALFTGVVSASSFDLVVVRGDNLIDYTVVSPYANSKGVPIVLVGPNGLEEDTELVLRSYRENNYADLAIVGGETAVSTEVQDDLEDMGFRVERFWDWDRYGTAGRVAVDLWRSSEEAVITDGKDHENLLMAMRYSLELGVPILFTENDEVPESTRSAIRKTDVQRVYLFGESSGVWELDVDVVDMDVEEIDFTREEEEEWEGLYLLGGLVAFVAALSMLLADYYRRQKKVPYDVFTDDEREIVDILLEEGVVEQKGLPESTGFSRPKVSRLVKDLEERDILRKEKKKKTYVLELNREIVK